MFMKKPIAISILACGSSLALSQFPINGSQSGLGSGSFAEPPAYDLQSDATVDTDPLGQASTPYACFCADADFDEILEATIKAEAYERSLPGLAARSADFVQQQDDQSDRPEPNDAPSRSGATDRDEFADRDGASQKREAPTSSNIISPRDFTSRTSVFQRAVTEAEREGETNEDASSPSDFRRRAETIEPVAIAKNRAASSDRSDAMQREEVSSRQQAESLTKKATVSNSDRPERSDAPSDQLVTGRVSSVLEELRSARRSEPNSERQRVSVVLPEDVVSESPALVDEASFVSVKADAKVDNPLDQ